MGGTTLTATATCTAFRGVCGGTPDRPGVAVSVSGRVLAERVGWLGGLVARMADQVVGGRWSDADLAVLAGGVGPDGRPLPSNGWMALRRLGWTAVAPAGVVVSDRVRRIAEEEAARALRAATHREAIIAALLSTWPGDPAARTGVEWSALRQVLPEGVDAATVRNRTRQIAGFLDREGRLPTDLCELEGPPRVAAQVILAAADRQHVVVRRVDAATVRVWTQLPTCPTPASYRDWVWHTLDVRLPPTVPAPAAVCSPTLRPGRGRVRVDLPWRVPHTPPPLRGHTRALGADWGVNTLLTGTLADLQDDGRVVAADGRPVRFDAGGVSAKLVRLRRHREQLKTKLDHLTRLRDGRSVTVDPALAGKITTLQGEHAAVCARIRNLNRALSWAAARWLVDHAIAAGAAIIYLEDLATLEAGGGSRSLNRRLSGQVRGVVLAAARHVAGKAGIGVVTVPARGTSSGCPRCGNRVKHVKAPDRAIAGYRWSTCTCGLSMDRDHAAAQRIVARGLANQRATRRDRDGNATIRTAVDVPVHPRKRRPGPTVQGAAKPVRDRRKTGPTRKRSRGGTARTSPLLPWRQQAPAPATTTGTGKRPAGRQPEATHPGRQVPHTISYTTTRRPHRVRAAIHGRGFHRHVHATPITIWDGNTGRTPELLRKT